MSETEPMTTAQALISFHDELAQSAIPEEIVAEPLMIAAKELTSQYGVAVRSVRNV